MQHVAEQNQSEERNPNVWTDMLPTPDVGENCGEYQRNFNGGGNGNRTAVAPPFSVSPAEAS